MAPKKKHHFVPVSYLKSFQAEDGKVFIYRKDAPESPIRQRPNKFAFHKYYYSQPRPGGQQDDNLLEDLFSNLEGKWPSIVHRFSEEADVADSLADIFAFVALQRVRVPAARDAAERLLAAQVEVAMRDLKSQGKLPAPPAELKGVWDSIEVAIQPYSSLHAMVPMLNGMAEVVDRLGLMVLRNQTSIDFLTSDNPVIYFDPTIDERRMRPYTLEPGGPIVLMMPVSPTLPALRAILGQGEVH